MNTYIPTEDEEQSNLILWTQTQKKYPELRLLFHIPNGGKRSKSEAARFQAMGVKPGVPDLFLPVARGGYHGLFIEMKRQKGGRVSDHQRKWMEQLERNGYRVELCCGMQEAKEALEEYLK